MIPLRLYLYAGLVLALLLSAWGAYAWVYGRGYSVAERKGQESIASLLADIDAQRATSEADARATEKAHREEMNAAAVNYETEKANAQAAVDRTIADLRSGAIRLRDEWAECETAALVSRTADAAARADDRARLRREGAANLVHVGEACDAQVRGLQATIRTLTRQ